MRLLLDTNVVLWQLAGTWRPPEQALEALEQAEEISFSVVSFAEIGIKSAIGKLVVPASLHEDVLRVGARILALDPEHGLSVAHLPMHHRDPFDRLLISQARCEGFTIITGDQRFHAYEVGVITA